MNKKEFESLLYTITANAVDIIMKNTNWGEDEALERFVRSEVYAQLEKEETKVWHYSATMLAKLFEEERTGHLVWPEMI